jgi:hypothetical protein
MTIHVGFAGYFAPRLYQDPARAARVAALLVDRRWPWPPWWMSCGVVGSFTKRTRSRKVVGARGEGLLRERMLDPEVRALELYRNSNEVENHAHAWIETGTVLIGRDWEQPFKVYGQTRAHDLPAGNAIEDWITLVHELMVTVDVGNAVMPVWPAASAVLADTTFGRIVVDSRWRGEIDLGPSPDISAQNLRESDWRDSLGGKYVRSPRWGTYLRTAHVEQVGGVDRIRSAVAPAKIVDLGALVFVQLTGRLEDATNEECEAKRRAFERVLAPLIAPSRIPPPNLPANST